MPAVGTKSSYPINLESDEEDGYDEELEKASSTKDGESRRRYSIMDPQANYSSYGELRGDLGMRRSSTSGLHFNCLANSTYGGGAGYFDPSVPDAAACKASDAARDEIHKELMLRLPRWSNKHPCDWHGGMSRAEAQAIQEVTPPHPPSHDWACPSRVQAPPPHVLNAARGSHCPHRAHCRASSS